MKTHFSAILGLLLLLAANSCDSVNTGCTSNPDLQPLFAHLEQSVFYTDSAACVGDTLMLHLRTDSPYLHQEYCLVFTDRIAYRFAEDLKDFKHTFIRIHYGGRSDGLGLYFNDSTILHVQQRYDRNPLYASFINYMLDSMTMDDIYEHEAALQGLYDVTGNAGFETKFVTLIYRFSRQCVGLEDGTQAVRALRVLTDVYTDSAIPLPERTRKLRQARYFLTRCREMRVS